MKEVKNKLKEKDEIEVYFSDIKKRNFPVGIILIILIMGLIGGAFYYYFVIDSPKNIFLSLFKNTVNAIKIDNTQYETISTDFSLETNIVTNNKKYIEITDLLNKFAINGNFSENIKEKSIYTDLNIFYESEELIGLKTYYKDKNTYLSIDKLYTNPIKIQLEEKETTDINNAFKNYDKEIEQIYIDTLKNNIIKTLNNGNYKKEYTKHNDMYVKKISLIIDKSIKEELLNNLISDNKFIESYSKLEGITKKETEEQLKKTLKELNNEKIKVSIYLSIIENKFIMADLTSKDYRFNLSETDKEYQYKYYEKSIIKYQGYINIEKNKNNNKILFTIDDVENQLNIEFNLEISYEYDVEIEQIDITNAKDYKLLTENDYNQIIGKISKDKKLNQLYTDILSLQKNNNQEEIAYS